MLPTSTWIALGSDSSAGKGGELPGSRSPRSGTPSRPEEAAAPRPSAFFLRLRLASRIQPTAEKTRHFPPGFSQGLAGGDEAGGGARLRGRRLLGRASPLHAGGRWRAAPCRAQRPVSTPGPRPPRRRLPPPLGQGCAGEFTELGRQARQARLGQRLRRLLHSARLRASFPTEKEGG